MQYKLRLTLRQKAALKIATSFWERKEIKDKAVGFFRSCDSLTNIEANKKWCELTKTVVDEWNKDELPHILEAELIHLVKMIGQTIFSWHQYIKYEYKAKEEAINCIDQIKWTPYGIVDVVNVFKSSWLENPNININIVYIFACRYAISDHINELWNKIPVNIQVCYHNIIYRYFSQHILAYWKHSKDDDLSNLIRYFRAAVNSLNGDNIFNFLYNLSRSTEENMLQLTVFQGQFIAMKYFWEKLTEEEKEKSVLKCARIAVLRCNDYKKDDVGIGDFKRGQYVEIIIFLINQMSKGHKKALFNNTLGINGSYHFDRADVKDEILKMILSTWPWQELFIPVLKDMLQCQDDNSLMDCFFLDVITKKMVENYDLGYSIEIGKYRYLLREAWLIIPTSIKRKMIQDNRYYEFVYNLVYVSDLDSLKLILNDPEIADVRKKYIYMGSCLSYDKFIENDEFEKLDRFIEEIFKSEKEKKYFRQWIEGWIPLINEGKFHLADKLLDWQSSTPAERQFIKSKIDYLVSSENLIGINDYETLDKFLDWRFDTEEEKINCKKHFKNPKFSIDWVCGVWSRCKKDINSAKNECSRFLHWIFESEEEIVLFKKGIVVDFESDESIMIYFDQLKRDGILNVFMSWCLLDDEHFQYSQRIKQAVVQSNNRPV